MTTDTYKNTTVNPLAAFPSAPLPTTLAEARDLLEKTRELLAAELSTSEALRSAIADKDAHARVALACIEKHEATLAAERKARDAEVMRIAEVHEAEIADLKARLEEMSRRQADAEINFRAANVELIATLDSKAEQKARLSELVDAVDDRANAEYARMKAAATEHARETIWAWMNTDKHVPRDWTAAHPPDDLTAQIMATLLGDDGFAAYSEAFRQAWREQVEAIADAREVRHGSGKVKI